jgi:hypothetical protein
MISKNLGKIITDYSDIDGVNPETDRAAEFYFKQMIDLIFVANNVFIGEIEEQLRGLNFYKSYLEQKEKANESVDQGTRCLIDETGQFIFEKESQSKTFELLSPKSLRFLLAGNEAMTPEQKVLAELLISEETNFILLNLAFRE